jgi:hypothetical protein
MLRIIPCAIIALSVVLELIIWQFSLSNAPAIALAPNSTALDSLAWVCLSIVLCLLPSRRAQLLLSYQKYRFEPVYQEYTTTIFVVNLYKQIFILFNEFVKTFIYFFISKFKSIFFDKKFTKFSFSLCIF